MPRAGERRERQNMKRSLIVSLVIAFAALGALFVSLPTSAQSSAPADLIYDPLVATMIGQVQTITVELYDQELSGRVAAIIGGAPYTITTRNTNSGTPIQKATQYAYERMQSAGLTVSYHDWAGCGISNRNVVGVMTGTLRPSEIVLITAHIDDMPSSGAAPGADDNASGSVGVLMAAEIMSQYHFERTVRFVLFTGEEQGLCGSAQYANYIYGRGDNVVAVYNMDMIAYDVIDGPTLRLHTRTTTNAGYPADLAIAGVFTNVVNTYGMSGALTPIVNPDGESASDHASFWSKGYPGILAIEDDSNDFNAYYHTINDNYDHVNLTYFTNYVKASIGAAAHLAYPIQYYAVLKGVVTDAGTALPIANAHIYATASITMTGITSTNASGVYTLPLLEGTYAVTYSAYGYQPQTITGLTLQPDVTTTQNVSLTAVPHSIYLPLLTNDLTGFY
jgi:Zn-dependent M28 family amino/carboxypeptidase